ncbi:hypothetical protein DH09_20895 [Bacillaceae bacterium JMAK1]|nr:hypothetical protein DH09_20895 [Bacillaceae bacterium JMAK1]
MTVTKDEVRQLVDRLTEENLDEVYNYLKDLLDNEEVELTDSEIEGIHDQDAYYANEEEASEVQKVKDLSSRGQL